MQNENIEVVQMLQEEREARTAESKVMNEEKQRFN